MKNIFTIWRFFCSLAMTTAALSLIAANVAAENTQDDVIAVSTSPFMATFAGGTTKTTGRLKVRIAGPDGQTVFESVSESGLVDWTADANLSDGLYRWDAWYTPQSALQKHHWQADDKDSSDPAIQYESGTFQVEGGVLLPRDQAMNADEQARIMAPIDQDNPEENVSWANQVAGMLLDFFVPPASAEQVFTENVRIEASGPRLIYEDTLSGAADWDTGHNSLLGGWFLRDLDADNVMFLAEAGAPDNSIFIESTGDIGMGNSTPEDDLHISPASTSASIRLENSQNAWRIEGHSGENQGFAIMERPGDGSQNVIFRILPGAPGISFRINSEGNVGLGTASPGKQLHVQGADASQLAANNVMARVENTTGTEESRRMLELVNNGSPLLVYRNTNSGETWSQNPVGGQFTITKSGTGQQEFQMDGGGNVTIQGSLTEDSRRASKDGFAKVDAETVLAKLDSLSIEEWHYKHTPDSRHIGPMAEEFHATFGIGPEDGIAPRDLAGVALAAAKALKKENTSLKAKVANMEEMETRLETLEKRLSKLAQ